MTTTLAQLWTEIKAEVHTVINTLEADVVFLEQKIVPVIEADFVLALGQLKTVAINAVLELASLAVSGQEKFGSAVTTVFQHAEANLIRIGIEDVRMLVQQVYDTVKVVLGEKQAP